MWEKGAREKNEDSLAFWHMQRGKENRAMAVICDGIGGLPKGEQASSYVVRQMANWFMSQGYRQKGNNQCQMVQQFLFQLHEELKEYGKENKIQMGTTITVVLLNNDRLYWFHCGDCRLYLFRKRKVKKLTGEHQDERGNLSRAIGVGEWSILEKGRLRLRKKDKILMCSDGLYRNINPEDLRVWSVREVKSDGQAERMLKQLFQKKMSLGEKDNLSALYFGYTDSEVR